MQRKRLVLLKERTLLFNSKVLEDILDQYPWLERFLEENVTATYSDLNSYDIEIQNFFNHRYNAIIKQAVAEWGMSDTRPVDIREREEMVECELCHQKPIVYVCNIKNNLNNKQLNVGSECVKNFGMGFKKDIPKLMSEQKKLKRLNNLNKSIPGIEATIRGWSDITESSPILIPNTLDYPFQKLGEQIRRLYTDFIEESTGMTDPDCIKEIKELLIRRGIQARQIQEYVVTNRHDKFAPTREIVIWARREAKDWEVLLTWLKEDGKITGRTAFRIGYPPFLESIVPEFQATLQDSGVVIQGVGEYKHTKGYVLVIQASNIRFFCNYRDFISAFSDVIFEHDGQIDMAMLVRLSSLYEGESIGRLLDILRAEIEKSGYRVYRYDAEFNEIIFEEKDKELYAIENLEHFIERVKHFALQGYSDYAELNGYLHSLGAYKKLKIEDINYFLGQRR